MTKIPQLGRVGGVAAATGCLVVAGLLVPAPTNAGLTTPSTLAPAGSAVALATDAAGNAAATWVAAGQVQVSRRTAGTPAWTPAVTVSPAGVSASEPDVSVGQEGTVAVVWLGSSPGVSPNVEIAVLPRGQGWVPARQVSNNPNWTDRDPQVEVGPAGVATVVWAATENGTTDTIVRSKTASATSISAQTALTAQVVGAFSGLSLARNAAGDTVAAWRLEGAAGSVQVSRRLSGQAWSAAANLATGTTVPDATSVAVDGGGHATIGWSSGAGAAAAQPMLARWPRGQASPSAGAPLDVAPGRQVQVAAATAGAVAATWQAASGLWFADGATVTNLSGAPVTGHALALGDGAAATVAYAPAGGGLAIAHRAVAPSTTWTQLPVPSAAGSVPAVAAHGFDATLVWSDGGAGAVQARTLDNGAPTSVHLTAPMRVLNVGKRIKAGWIGADTWSPISYEVERVVSTYRTPGVPSTWLTTTATDAPYTAKPGETVCLRVRGADTAGNASGWSVPRCATVAVNDRTLKQKKLRGKAVWKTVKKAKGSYGRDYALARARGATLTLPVQARRIALLVSTGPGHGSVSVSLGKDKLGTFSLASGKAATQVVVPVRVLPGVRKGRLKITVTSKGKPVRIDGVYAGVTSG